MLSWPSWMSPKHSQFCIAIFSLARLTIQKNVLNRYILIVNLDKTSRHNWSVTLAEISHKLFGVNDLRQLFSGLMKSEKHQRIFNYRDNQNSLEFQSTRHQSPSFDTTKYSILDRTCTWLQTACKCLSSRMFSSFCSGNWIISANWLKLYTRAGRAYIKSHFFNLGIIVFLMQKRRKLLHPRDQEC